MGRIIDYPEITALSEGDYLIVDNAEGGTKKVSAQSVAGTVDPTPTEGSTNAVSSGGVWTSLNDISEEFDGLRTDAYDVYPKGIASGDIVQFETGADNVPLSDLTGYIYPMMSGSGMPSRTNIRTISGPDDINIYQRNKNLIEQITYQAEPETVYLGVQNSSNLTMFFKAGDYRITVNIVGGSTVEPYWSVGSTATHSEYMHLDNDSNVSIYVYDADGISASDIASFQVEVGTEATDYVEFEGDITNVVLPTDRGTIYSGRVALTAGKVYIDTVIYERNSSTMNNTEDKPGWAYTGLQTYDVAIGTFDDVIYWPNGDVRCTNVNVGSTYSIEVANEDYSLILPRNVYNMSQSQWISAGVDIQILVKLNTPIEIDIDPVEVRSLYGFNTYYCNSGKTGVIFGMDLAKHIASKTSEAEDEMEKKIEKAFATDTASGAVATFADGADDIPMKSVKVAIEPVQDLHGQDAPYPAGGGTNQWDEDYQLGFWSTEGNFIASTSGYLSSKNAIPVSPETKYTLVCKSATVQTFYAAYWTSNNEFISRITNSFASAGIKEVTTPTNAAYMQFTMESFYGTTYKNDIAVNYPSSVTTYSPYSNICPISGWTGANVVRTGKNLLNPDILAWVVGRTYRYMHGVVPTDTPARFTFIDKDTSVNISGMYIGFSKETLLNNSPKSYSWAISNGEIQNDQSNSAVNGIKGVLCSNIMIYPNTEEVFNALFSRYYIMVELGSTATDYEPYQGNTYSITLPTEAGTVYGGELDVTNGVLTVDRGYYTVTNATILKDEGAYTDFKRWSLMQSGGIVTGKPNGAVISNVFVQGTLVKNGIFCHGSTGAINITPQLSIGTAAQEVLAWLIANNVQLCYELATPITYHLTPTEIKSLLGDNNLWADAGNTEVTYRADTTMYIDKKIAEVVSALS